VVVLIDEAHAMPDETLEEIRLLSNLESNRHKLLQIVLFGQPEFDEHLDARHAPAEGAHHSQLSPGALCAATSRTTSTFACAPPLPRSQDFQSERNQGHSSASQGLTRRVNILSDKALLGLRTGSHAVTQAEAKRAVRDTEFHRTRTACKDSDRRGCARRGRCARMGNTYGLSAGRSAIAPAPAGHGEPGS